MYNTFIKPLAKDVKDFAIDTLFPQSCVGCGKEGELLCFYCRSTIKEVAVPRCIACQKPAPFGLTHPGCKTPQLPEGLICVFDYRDERLANAIIKGKYSFMAECYQILGKMAAEKIKSSHTQLLKENYILTPVPLYKMRQRWRGFNQAQILCQSLSAELGLPMAEVLTRQKYTKTQKDLKRTERIQNVADAFGLVGNGSPRSTRVEAGLDHSLPRNGVRGKNFILVDDVATTGSTLLQATKVLKRNGAKKIWCLAIARD